MAAPQKADVTASAAPKSNISLIAAVAIGVGGMIGAGIFSILGVVANVAGTSLPIVFVVGAIIAVFSVYSYTKLGERYPSVGGPVQFLVQGFGDGVLSGGLNIFQYIAYVISLALYADGFAGYAIAFWKDSPPWAYKAIAVGIVLLFVLVNFIGAAFMGKAETVIVGIKVAILLFFAVAGLFFLDPTRLSPSGWKPPIETLFAVTIVFIGYQGFGLVTNAAGDMKNVKKELPRAMAISFIVTVIIYVLVGVTVIGTTPMSTITSSTNDVLSVVAKGFLGIAGFYALAIAALLSTSSAVNATLFGAANMAYQVAKDGELPKDAFMKQLWHKNVEGLFITAGAVILLVLFLDLTPISMMASGAFLVVYTAVNYGHTRIAKQTGAKVWILWGGVILTGLMFLLLMVYMFQHSSPVAWISFIALLVGSFVFEAAYRKTTGRTLGKVLLD